MKNKKPTLTNEEKILLNLQHLIAYAEEFEVPPRMTQEGMARYLGAARPNITRSLKNLIRKGQLDERLAHITGHRRRKKVYSLTPTGMVEAERLERALRKNMGLERSPASVLESYLVIPEGADMTVKKAHRRQGDAPPRERNKKPFFGREAELARMEDWYGDKDPLFLVITGIAGIGKTTLARRFLSLKDTDHVWYQFHEANTLEGMLHQLGLRLSLFGYDNLMNLTNDPASVMRLDGGAYSEALMHDLDSGSIILAFDDFHLASQRVRTFFATLLRTLDTQGAEGIKLLLTSRKKGGFYNRRDVKVNGRVVEVDLEGLDAPSSRSLLESKGITVDNFEQVYSVTRGHPLALELTDDGQDLDLHKDALEFVREEIFQNLSVIEKTLVELMSVYRYPVPRGWLVEKGTEGQEALDNLADRSIVRYIEMGYDLHGLIKEFTYERLGMDEKTMLHETAARQYSEHSQDFLDDLEAVHHLVRSGNASKGAQILASGAEEMISEGFFEVSYALDSMEGRILEPPLEVWMDYIRGALLISLGDTESARKELIKALGGIERVPPEERSRLELRINEKLAGAEAELGDTKRSQAFYRKAEAAYSGIRGPAAADELIYAGVLNGRALISRKEGRVKEAKNLYTKGLAVLEKMDNPGLQAVLNYNLGRILEDEGDVEEALERYRAGLELAESAGDDQLMLNICTTLGEVHSHMKQWDRALEYFERGLAHAVMSRDMLDTTRAYLEMASEYSSSMAPKGLIGKFRSYFSSKNDAESQNISILYEKISSLYVKRRDWKAAGDFNRQAVDIFERCGDQRMEAKAHNNLGFIHKQKKEHSRAIDEYNKALALLERTGDARAQGITLFNIGAAYDARGDTGKRDSYFKRAEKIFVKHNMKRELRVLEDW